jgi:hypothetical protein
MCAAAPPQLAGVGRTERCPWVRGVASLFPSLFSHLPNERRKKRKIRILVRHHVVECLLHAMMLATVPMAAMSVALE